MSLGEESHGILSLKYHSAVMTLVHVNNVNLFHTLSREVLWLIHPFLESKASSVTFMKATVVKVEGESQENKCLTGGRGLRVAHYHAGICWKVEGRSPLKAPTHCISFQLGLLLACWLSFWLCVTSRQNAGPETSHFVLDWWFFQDETCNAETETVLRKPGRLFNRVGAL